MNELYSGRLIKTELGIFGVYRRDNGIEILLDGKSLVSLTSILQVKHYKQNPCMTGDSAATPPHGAPEMVYGLKHSSRGMYRETFPTKTLAQDYCAKLNKTDMPFAFWKVVAMKTMGGE